MIKMVNSIRCVVIFLLVDQALVLAKSEGIADDISKGQQKLSPYELAMVSDLLVQISMYRCPAVSRPAMKSMKRFVFKTFSKAPDFGFSHPLFYSNYRTLVECLNYVDLHFPKKSLAVLNQQKGLDNTERRKKRATANSKSDELNSLFPGEEIKKPSGGKTPFELLFKDLYGIVQHSCPSELVANTNFITTSMTEIVEWITLHDMAILAHEKYFNRLGLLKQIHKCFNLISSITN